MPECYADTNLISALLNQSCNHQKGCATVCKNMEEKYGDSFAVGIIDADKKKPSALMQYDVVESCDCLSLLKHKNKPHYMILVCPAIENFILNAASSIGVNPQEYGIPSDLEKLKVRTKVHTAKQDPDLRRLNYALLGAPSVSKLRKLLSYLVEIQYQADINVLREIVAQ